MKNGKFKRIVALIGAVILAGLFITTLIAAVMAKPYANNLFMASIYSSLIVPVMIYAIMLVGRVFAPKDENSMRLSKLRRIKKDIDKIGEETSEEDVDDGSEK